VEYYDPMTHRAILDANTRMALIYRDAFLGGEVATDLRLFDLKRPGVVPDELLTILGFKVEVVEGVATRISFIQSHVVHEEASRVLRECGHYILDFISLRLKEAYRTRLIEV